MPEWTHATTLKELRRRRRMLAVVAGLPVALFLAGDQVYALHDVCIHKQRSLSRGTILAGRVVCPGHQWTFDLATGYVEEQDRCAVTYPVRVDGEDVYVLPEGRVLVPPGVTQAAGS